LACTQISGIVKQETQLSLGKVDCTAYVRSPASDFQSRKESDLSEVRPQYICTCRRRIYVLWWDSSMHAMLTERCFESYSEH